MDMVERVARALYAIRMETAQNANLHEPYTWETDNNAYREHCLREARAVIEAVELYRLQRLGEMFSDKPPKWARDVLDTAALTPPPSGQEM